MAERYADAKSRILKLNKYWMMLPLNSLWAVWFVCISLLLIWQDISWLKMTWSWVHPEPNCAGWSYLQADFWKFWLKEIKVIVFTKLFEWVKLIITDYWHWLSLGSNISWCSSTMDQCGKSCGTLSWNFKNLLSTLAKQHFYLGENTVTTYIIYNGQQLQI